MILTYLMLLVALCLSAVAAFYSIVGLAAIFAAAVIPIVVMGSILEVAKLVVTVWLHEYWRQVKLSLKLYLVPAVGILMLITSMGIFGFLSKAHLDQAVPTGDVAAQVALLDEKIRTQRDNIDTARKALTQMDAAVDQTMARSSDEKGADKAAALRRSQARERNNLQSDIARAQTEIAKLNEQRAPVASQLRKVEAEVGPIKYIAALIYGDNPDANLLEKAVRWVIIILVTVFDPLAIFMLLAFTESLRWERDRRRGLPVPDPEPPAITQAMTRARDWTAGTWSRLRGKSNGTMDLADTPTAKDMAGHDTGHSVDPEPVVEMVEQSGSTQLPATSTVTTKIETVPESLQWQNPDVSFRVDADEEDDADDGPVMKQARALWKHDNPRDTLKEQRRLLELGKIDRLPWEDYVNDPRILNDVGYGPVLPDSTFKGKMWVLTGQLPTQLYKFNGTKWIATDKALSDAYSYNQSYIDFLIQLIGTGEYDPELLTDAERSQIESRLKQNLQ
jgi:hypothetical protein